MNLETIEQFAGGGLILQRAIAGLTKDQLLAHPIPGTWSIQEIVVHLMDSDLIATDRMKRILVEDNPALNNYDESAFVRDLFYQEQSIEDAVMIFDLNRRQFARVLRKLPPDAFARGGLHSRRGPVTLGQLLELYTWHLGHHLKFICQKRELLGNPLPAGK